jgi:pilus assembly protein CpaD
MTRRPPTRRPTARLPLFACAALASAVAGCAAPDRVVTGSTFPHDYRQRHPIVLSEGPKTLDVFVNGHGLDARQRQDVRAFAAEYRRFGRGGIVAQVPAGSRQDIAAHHTLDAIRAALAEGGVLGGYVSVATYPVIDPVAAAPIRLVFQRLQAKVASVCGQWPKDLGVSDAHLDGQNEAYWNLGCALQSNVATQIDDPVDLVRGRTESRPDTVRRSRDIDEIRKGKDPSTTYRQDGQNKINQTVGN